MSVGDAIAFSGQLALSLALMVALVLGSLPVIGAARGRADWMALARPCTFALAALVVAAYACLTSAFVMGEFSLALVAQHSNNHLPLVYRIAAVWGSHEGSLLLWLLMLSGWAAAVAGVGIKSSNRTLPLPFLARVLGVMGWIAAGFLLFSLATSNPFARLSPVPIDGADLNPLLQDPGMAVHPPMLYMGYVGLSVAFAFAIAALLSGQLDAAWARWTRPWTAAAWVCLTIGITLGSGWAYYELGWGGWWFWDPVENASFMPWLVATALIHSLAVTEKRNSFKAWTVLLAIVAFSLSLLGTFVVRSGILSSVHSFASDPRRGLFILGFLAITVGGALALYAWRAPTLGLGRRSAALSRETALLLNNVLLTAAAGAVLLGTLYPLMLEGLNGSRISVGPPYFDRVFALLMVPLLMLLGVGPLLRWKQDASRDVLDRLHLPAVLAVLVTGCLAWVASDWPLSTWLGLALSAWIVATVFADLRKRVLPEHAADALHASLMWQRLRQTQRPMWGMWLAHIGVAVFCLGVTLTRTTHAERDVQLSPGGQAELQGYQFNLQTLQEATGPNYRALRAHIEVEQAGKLVAVLEPEKRLYDGRPGAMTEAAIDSSPLRDLYVSMDSPVGGPGSALRGPWIVRVQVRPFQAWIWSGCVLMALGGALAASDPRYRKARRTAMADAHAAEPVSALADARSLDERLVGERA